MYTIARCPKSVTTISMDDIAHPNLVSWLEDSDIAFLFASNHNEWTQVISASAQFYTIRETAEKYAALGLHLEDENWKYLVVETGSHTVYNVNEVDAAESIKKAIANEDDSRVQLAKIMAAESEIRSIVARELGVTDNRADHFIDKLMRSDAFTKLSSIK